MKAKRGTRTAGIKKYRAVQSRARRLKQHGFLKAVLAIMQRFPLRPTKKNIAIAAVILAISLSVPFLFAAASNTNQVAKAAAITTQAKAVIQTSATPAPSTFAEGTPTPAATGGELVGDLTEKAVQKSAAPSPNPSLSSSVVSPEPSPSKTPAPPAATPAATPSAIPSADIAYTPIASGVNDPFVAMIQQRLMDLGYMDQDEPTTLLGPITSEAVSEFQRKNGLTESDVADVQTQTVLFSNNAKAYIISEGDSGLYVQSIQERLAELGYNVKATGNFGEDTAEAVHSFQRASGLLADGAVGDKTREALFSPDAKPFLEEAAQNATPDQPSADSIGNSAAIKKTSGGSAEAETAAPPSPPAPPAPQANGNKVEAFINAALAQVGKSYVLGGKGPDVFDCSGLVFYSLQASGNGIPYMTSGNWGGAGQYACIGSMNDLQRGDVICEHGHVAIYLGNGQVVHASSSNGKVVIAGNIFSSSYWTGNFICGRRPL